MINEAKLLENIKKEVKKTFAKVFILNGKKPCKAFTHKFENDEKIVTTKLRSIDKKGNAIVDIVTEYKLPLETIEIRGQIK